MIHNVHQRILACSQDQAAHLIDSLAGPQEALWPNERWPRLKLDAGLTAGSQGGHGPIRYFVEDYQAGNSVRFRFTRPSGFRGTHAVYLKDHPHGCLLEHDLRMATTLWGWIQWQFIFRPLHDALIEDALDRAAGQFPRDQYSPWVRLLRFLLS
jgi:hypothetical protein